MASPALTKDQVLTVARRITELLGGLPHYYVGSAASALWGASCAQFPNNIELVLTQRDFAGEGVDIFIVAVMDNVLAEVGDGDFFFKPSTNPGNQYLALWFALEAGAECKVDILIPPTLKVPFIEHWQTRVPRRDGLPVAPLLVQLLLKVQAWADHRMLPRADIQAKEPVDVANIGELLEIGKREDMDLRLAQEEWGAWPCQFMAKVRNFVWVYPETRGAWKDVGLDYDMIVYKDGVAHEP